MMNLIALSLILTSFAVSGLFSPNPVTNNNGDQVIVKDGHRAVVVEYADDFSADGNTKVLISPPHHHHSKVPEEEGEALSRAAASVAGVAKDAVHGGGPRELICDAYGKCKHKVAGVLGRAKEKAAEAEEKARDKTGDLVHETKEKVRETGEMARDKTGDLIHDAKEKVRETGGKLRDKTEGMVYDTKEKVKETGEKIRDKTEDIVHETKEKVKETGEKTEETKEKGKKEITEIGRRGKEVMIDMIRYILQGVETVGSMMNLMGFGIAYGTGVWVTFAMSYVLARVLGRQQFGVVQSKVYPVYFKGMVGGIGLALLGHLLGHGGRVFRTKGGVLQVYNLMGSLVSVLGNLLFLEPRATKVMFERMKLEKEEGRGIDSRGAPVRVIDAVVTEPAGAAPTTTTTTTAAHTTVAPTQPVRPEQDAVKSKLGELDERLKKLNSYSSLLNIMTLIGLTWHLVYLSQRLNVTT